MPRIRVEDYEDDFDDDDFKIDDDEPKKPINPPRPPKQDMDWEERRKEMIYRRAGKARD